jgi:hypothetical protein
MDSDPVYRNETLAPAVWGTLDFQIQLYIYQYEIKPNYPGDTIILPGNPLLGQG